MKKRRKFIFILTLVSFLFPCSLLSQIKIDSISSILQMNGYLPITFGCNYNDVNYKIKFSQNPFQKIMEELKKESIESPLGEKVAVRIVIYDNIPFVENVEYFGTEPQIKWLLKTIFHTTILTMLPGESEICKDQVLKRSTLLFQI